MTHLSLLLILPNYFIYSIFSIGPIKVIVSSSSISLRKFPPFEILDYIFEVDCLIFLDQFESFSTLKKSDWPDFLLSYSLSEIPLSRPNPYSIISLPIVLADQPGLI